MKKRTVLVCWLAIALLFVLAKIVKTEPPQSDPFITKLPVRIYLPPQDSKEEFRTESYAQDGFNRIKAVREFRDGVTETVEFRPDGTLAGYTELYPAGADGLRQMKSNAGFDENGRFFISHQVYRKDGTLERTGEKLRDGGYESKFYFDDGKTINRHRLFDAKHTFVVESVFNSAGVRIAIRYKQGDNFHFSLYHESGAHAVLYTKTMFGEAGTVLAADGQTVLFEFAQDPWTTKELHYNEQGKPVQLRTFVRMIGSTDITIFNPDGTLRYKQVWRQARRTKDGPIEPILSRVIEAKKKRLYRTVELNKDGKPTSVTYQIQGGRTVIKQLAGGKIITSVKTIDSNGKVVSEVQGTGEVEHFDPAMFIDPPHPERQTFVDENAPPLIYDYK